MAHCIFFSVFKEEGQVVWENYISFLAQSHVRLDPMGNIYILKLGHKVLRE